MVVSLWLNIFTRQAYQLTIALLQIIPKLSGLKLPNHLLSLMNLGHLDRWAYLVWVYSGLLIHLRAIADTLVGFADLDWAL